MNITRRGFVSSVAGLVAWQASRQFGFAEEASKPPAFFAGPVETVKLTDDLYVLLGAGGNVTVHFNDKRLFVIDAGVPNRGADLLAAATKFAPQATHKTLFNTHWHFDHVGGNELFADAGFNVVSSATCRERLSQTINLADLGMVAQPLPESARPTVTFEQSLALFDISPVRVTKLAPAHTDTDAVLFFDKHNTLVTGDVLFAGVFPVIDRSTGGSLDGMIAATTLLLTLGDDKTRVVPGHGPVGEKATLQAQLELLNLTKERLAPFGEKKATVDEVLAAAPLADLDDKWGRGFLRSPVYTRMAYGQWIK